MLSFWALLYYALLHNDEKLGNFALGKRPTSAQTMKCENILLIGSAQSIY